MRLKLFFVAVTVMAVLAGSSVAWAQGATATAATNALNQDLYGNVQVYLRTEDGELLPKNVSAAIVIAPAAGGSPLPIMPQMLGEGWLFSGLAIGNDYKVQVVASGYLPGEERVRLADTPGASSTVIVFMRPVDQELVFHAPTGQFLLAPKAQKEIQHALEDLRYGRVASAQKHTQIAIQVSPDNPYVQYVMGLSYLLTHRVKEAQPYLEKSVSIDPRQPLALTALGTVRYRLGDYAGAVLVFTKAVEADGTSWKAEWMLAQSYLREKKFAEARDHAEQALRIGQRKADQVQLVLGLALANLGERDRAAALFDTFAKEFPNDANTPDAVKWAKLMREPVTTLPGTGNLTASFEPPVEVPPRPDWAPPDIDAAKPFVVSDAACPLPQILKVAGKTAERLVSNLQEFTAREDFQDVEIKRGGQVAKPSEHVFNYLVFIDQISPQAFDVRESRNDGSAEVELPVVITDTGVPALALAFHPIIQPDLDWKCEGLGTWDDQPAWVIRFEQKPAQPNVLSLFTSPSHNLPLPLKGRAWVFERTGQVLHLETDLVNAIGPVDLRREHHSISYKEVSFQAHNVDLWLPESVDTYFQYRGHFLHYNHRFSNFKLFWVGASEKIGAPKGASGQQDEQQP
ncbi:MAG TPA: tetratricopeptide repeat protein [Candidatus Cybelea sp.]|nr:tetratricopeptide repeat protein [Candidatus Cybelea sp.]